MAAIREIRKLKDRVLKMLRDDPKYRDSDRKICARIWAEDLGGVEKSKAMSVYDFLCKYSDGIGKDEVHTADSITRVRRLLQQKHPELRGASYIENHGDKKQREIKLLVKA